jgi:hypothetical protein
VDIGVVAVEHVREAVGLATRALDQCGVVAARLGHGRARQGTRDRHYPSFADPQASVRVMKCELHPAALAD